MVEHIKPSVLINGVTYYPSGWMYILAFAIAGCQWAIDDVATWNNGAYI